MWCSLIGFMGAGKSTVADLLAEHAFVPAIDLDEVIETREGRTVGEIFADDGEAAFREIESSALASLSPDEERIVACGGGIVQRADNVTLLRERGPVVWLDLPWESVRARLAAGADGVRPLVAHLGWEGLEALHRARSPLYAAAAHFRLRADQDDPEVLGRRVLACRSAWERDAGERT